ncbi:MAG: hypothetical protein AMK71_08145 [Nitrospira bacterium SG8_35_4]|nr:MAG: hypothetical protein AMK71_08145 [Nitrospira bacterium SG8_35_4]
MIIAHASTNINNPTGTNNFILKIISLSIFIFIYITQSSLTSTAVARQLTPKMICKAQNNSMLKKLRAVLVQVQRLVRP